MIKLKQCVTSLFTLLILLFMVGCGSKGDLYQTPIAPETNVVAEVESNENQQQQNIKTSENSVTQENK